MDTRSAGHRLSDPQSALRSSQVQSAKRFPSAVPKRVLEESINREHGENANYGDIGLNRSHIKNISSAHKFSDTPLRSSSATASFVNPNSSLLQNLINEQRASRGVRVVSSDHDSDNRPRTPSTIQQRDGSTSEKQRRINDALSAGLKQPREMGVREMDQYVSKMNKLNFDLKLEIFHREQQAAAQEKKLERMQELEDQVQHMGILEDELQELRAVEEDNQRLRRSNEVLRLEIDKRDQAVDEAVDLICQLESKLEELEVRNGAGTPTPYRPNTDDDTSTSPIPWTDALTPRSKAIVDVPDRTSSRKGTRSKSYNLLSRTSTPTLTPRRPRHTPSFLKEQSSTTSMLRNVYLTDTNKSRAALSTISKTETIRSGDETYEPDSPRLSILSECSYLDDPLGALQPLDLEQKHTSSRADEINTSPISYGQDRDLSRIERWIQPHPDLSNESPKAHLNGSIKASTPTTGGRRSLGAAFEATRSIHTSKSGTTKVVDGNMFDGGRLPPTPDTMSTAYIDMKDKHRGSIVAERSSYVHPQRNGLEPVNTFLGRRQSADDITTRPSTAETVLIDRIGAWDGLKHNRRSSIGGSYPLASMFPTFEFAPTHSSQLFDTGSAAVEPRLIDGGDMAQRDGGPVLPVITPTKPQSRSNSPPLTPQDWLDAALPEETSLASGKETATRTQTEHSPDIDNPMVDTNSCQASKQTEREETPREFYEADDLQDQSPLAGSRVDPPSRPSQPLVDSQSRRRLSLRPPFFSRSSNKQTPTTIPPENGRITPTSNIKSNRLSSLGQFENSNITSKSIGQPVRAATTPTTDVTPNSLSRSTSQFGSISIEAAPVRPYTSGSAEHKRRGSHGFFGWIKGSSGAGSTPPARRTAVTPTPDEANSIKSMRTGDRKPGSNRAPRPLSALSFATSGAPSSPLDRISASIPGDSPNTNTRSPFTSRRNRRA